MEEEGLVDLRDIMRTFLRNGPSKQLIHEEQAFRRGYHQGYDQAIEHIFDLLDKGLGVDDAYSLSALYVNLIGVWRTEGIDQFIVPPSFDQQQLQATLQLRRKVGKA